MSLTDTDRLLEANERSIEIEKLEKYILGKKSVELEIEFGIPISTCQVSNRKLSIYENFIFFVEL